ncbi:TlpA family protein disulfide reductase [Corynebacterium pseudotuberculosis]|uniref:Redoxin family protein n=1 Tax=Corynebacterium pseudotuberculosis (strain C231) TaxID=681645 RepID=D9QDY2_CORP2|nr:TlpA disulfide reductase family protein [Corynebacterium pseudotuberculosis]ADK28001.1 redoxin family protein [Corynebacterium pseudotuberculosis FRC41]ADL09705.1 redoxin family protein [Corynebacterium pseudotuberculosis C231]ADL20111.1 TlpA family protein disulfide reductase [Corynebacterium pseudotuberculosis 1002]ADO25500.1 redoxin family protein [Corynebacterium pseudotuberculosis I19]AEK91549.1 Thioredoxin-related protein [Corynebacterium pseudotuberculosis PAT10]
MKKTIAASFGVFVVMLVFLLAVVPQLLRGDNSGNQNGSTGAEGTEATAQNVQNRPECPIADLGGVSLPCLGAQHRARPMPAVTVVSLWAWWCEPCRKELPLFDELAAKHPEFSVIGVHADPNAANGAALLNDLGIQMPSLQDNNNNFAASLGLPKVVPITLVFDQNGKLISTIPKPFEHYGELESAVLGKLPATVTPTEAS